ncbi:hypothetical protein CYY_003877 [Polysphondylium violaceum]|uniref:Uncharacterized protein n=1 Tax=Polysphondylium violaceum TaxID=133409 RepID=A0A8J4PVI7_9MYCE|nr:hypothetical protein CYY_003877 [Polysphondylium violaceum]
MKNYCLLLLLPFLLLLVQPSASVTLSISSRTPYLNHYAFGTTCQYNYTVGLLDLKGVNIISPSTITIQSVTQTRTSIVAIISYTVPTGTSGNLVLKTTNNDTTPFDFTLDAYECLAAPFIEYETVSWSKNPSSFGIYIKVKTPLTKYLYGQLFPATITSTQYFLYYNMADYQIYGFNFLILSPVTGILNQFNLVVKVSATQTLTIQITPPFISLPYLGHHYTETSTENSYYSMSFLKYENNLNNNTFLLKTSNQGGYMNNIVEGNPTKGTLMTMYNRRGLFVAAAAVREECYSLSSTSVVVFDKIKNILAATKITPSTYSSTYTVSNNRPSIVHFNAIYSVPTTKIYDRTHSISLTKVNILANQYLTFPYGISTGSLSSGFRVSLSYPSWAYFNNTMSYTVGMSNPIQSLTRTSPNYNPPNPTPTVKSLTYIGQFNGRYSYRISINDTIIFNKITAFYTGVDSTDQILATSANLVSGDGYDGTYEFSHDISGLKNARVINDNGYYAMITFPTTTPVTTDYSAIKGISFSTKFIDTTHLVEPVKVRVSFDYAIPNINFKFIMYTPGLYITQTSDQVYYDMVFNPESQLYEVDIDVLPRRTFTYYISSYSFMVYSMALEVMFPESVLTVVYDNLDEMPPMVSSVTHSPSSSITIDSAVPGYTTANFIITIKDTYNGLKNGTIWIASDLDPVGFNFTIDPSMATSGDMYLGTYSLPIKINRNCVSQSYFIQDMKLFDNSNIISSVYAPYPNPFFNESINAPLAITCSGTRETVAPILTSFVINTAIPLDVSAEIRNVVIDFTVTDTDSGIDEFRTPTVYASEPGFRYVSSKSVFISTGVYRATVSLPYGFGAFGGVYFSIYGIIDNHLNFNGYSTADLQSLGFANSINTTLNFTPFITNASFSVEYNLLTVKGFSFGSDGIIEYTTNLNPDAVFYQNTQTQFRSSNLIAVRRSFNTEPFKIRINKNGVISNTIIVEPVLPWLPNVLTNEAVQRMLLILQLIEQPLIIQPNKLAHILQLVTSLETNADIPQLETILQILKSRPTPQLQAILQLRQIIIQNLGI